MIRTHYGFGIAVFVCAIAIARPASADAGIAFSSLPADRQAVLRQSVQPPPLAQRQGPYSTPMYYLMHKGYAYDGSEDKGPAGRCYIKDQPGPEYGSWKLDRNRPDWQEAMIADLAELGMNNTHLNIYPQNNSLAIDSDYLRAIEDFATLSAKHGLKVGVRLDALGGTVAWEMNPANPENQIEAYLDWVKTIATRLKDKTAYYVLGDELTLHEQAKQPKDWTAENYLKYFKQVAAAIKSVDPTAKVSMFAASSGEWFNVLHLLKLGYAEVGDAVAINYPDYVQIPKFFDEARKLAPNLMFLSNGVGYCSLGSVSPRYPEGDPYSKQPTEEAHAAAIAKTMFAWWDLGAATAPYYISLRNWVRDGKTYPRWFGFFGFEDYDISGDTLTVKRYPGWYAYQTIANTFYNRAGFKPPAFAVKSSAPLTMLRAYEHGQELVVMGWNDDRPVKTSLLIDTSSYKYPVRLKLADHKNWSDVPYDQSGGRITIPLEVGPEPVVIRLFRQP